MAYGSNSSTSTLQHQGLSAYTACAKISAHMLGQGLSLCLIQAWLWQPLSSKAWIIMGLVSSV